MCPAQRDTLTGHFFASLCPLRQFANCFALSATIPQGTQGRLDFIAGHFYVPRSTRHSDGTLFSRPCVPCVNLLIVLHCRPLFLKGRKDVGTLLRDIFMCPAQRDTLTVHFFTSQCPVLTNRFPEFGVQHEGTGAGGVSTVLYM